MNRFLFAAALGLAGAAAARAADVAPVLVPGTFIEPTVHLETARLQTPPGARLIAATADLRDPRQAWVYSFHCRQTNEVIDVRADAAGRTAVLGRMRTWDTFVPIPINLKHDVISLAKAREVLQRLGAEYTGVFITRSFSQRRAIFRFDGAADYSVIVDGETGELAAAKAPRAKE